MNGANKDRATGAPISGSDAGKLSADQLLLNDLRLQELLGQHDRIMGELTAPDPLVEAYTSVSPKKQSERNTGRHPDRPPGSAINTPDGISTHEDAQGEEERLPVKVGSLQELQAHLDHGRRQKQLREKRQALLSTMLKEGMPLDLWVLTGDNRYVRLEKKQPAAEMAADPITDSVPNPLPTETAESEGAEHDQTALETSPHETWGPANSSSPPPRPGHHKDDHRTPPNEKPRQAPQDGPSGAKEPDTVTGPGLRFYCVRKEALGGLPSEVPATEIEQVSHKIECFEALPRIRRFGLINYPFLALVCLAAFWLISTLFVGSSSWGLLSLVLLAPLACVALLHFDSGLNGPRAIREQKRLLTERYGRRPGRCTDDPKDPTGGGTKRLRNG